jgi:hypothetical protein
LRLIDSNAIDLSSVQLKDPLRDLHAANVDAEFAVNVTLLSGERINLVELGKRICNFVREQLDNPIARLPKWAPEFVDHWQNALGSLCDNQQGFNPIWRDLRRGLKNVAAAAGICWSRLAAYDAIHSAITAKLGSCCPPGIISTEVLARTSESYSAVKQCERILQNYGITVEEFGHVLESFPGLYEFATRYFELSPGSTLVSLMERSNWPGVSITDVDSAVSFPPADTRAQIRGQFVAKYSMQPGYSCSWQTLYQPKGSISIDDPFIVAQRE